METEIKAIIEKNLPAQVGEVLKQRLEQAEKNEILLKQADELIKALKGQTGELNEALSNYEKYNKRNSELEAREDAVKAAERNLEIEKLTFQLACEKEKTGFSQSVAMGLVRNTEYRRSVFDSKSGPEGKDQYGNQQWATHTVKTDETKSTD